MFAGMAPAQTEPPPAYGPPLKLALLAAQTALDSCAKAGFKVGVAVVDSSGAAKVILTGDGAASVTGESAAKKAMSAIKLGMSTPDAIAKEKTDKDFADKIAADKTLFVHPGASLLKVGDKIAGAVAASGAPHGNGDDDKCALAGIAKIEKKLK
jgi:uncharacterized protein GlcG (DUF336 family)